VQKEKEALSESISSVARILSSLRIDRDYAQAVCSEEILEGNCNRGRLMAFLLSRFDTGHYEPRIHYTTRDDDQKRSALLRQKIKRIVVVSLSCAAAIFSLAVVFAVFLALRKRPMIVEEAVRAGKEERKKMEEIEDWRGKKVLVEESPGLDELESRQSLLHTGWGQHSGMGTRRFFVQIAMLAAVTAALFGLLAVLITYMRWTFEI
jgi:hypothetical protein